MVGRTPLFSIHSTIADEQGAQHACNSTSVQPSGTIITGFFITSTGKKLPLFCTETLRLTADELLVVEVVDAHGAAYLVHGLSGGLAGLLRSFP